MPDPLPWLRELLAILDSGTRGQAWVYEKLTALITCELSRERAAAVEECRAIARGIAARNRTSGRKAREAGRTLVAECRQSDVETCKAIEQAFRSLSALPLEAAATPTPEIREAPDAEYLRKYSEAVRAAVITEIVEALDARQRHCVRHQNEDAAGIALWGRRAFEAGCSADIARSFLNDLPKPTTPPEPLTHAAVREIVLGVLRGSEDSDAAREYRRDLGRIWDTLHALESRDVRAEIERYIDELAPTNSNTADSSAQHLKE